MPSVHRKIKESGRGPCPAGSLRERASGRGHGLMLARDKMASRPCRHVHHTYIVDPTKLKYLAVTVMTAESTVLAKSVRFLEHVSPKCCAGIASIVQVSWSA